MFGLAVEPKARGDEQKISGSLHKIADEDPTFKVTRDPQTHELVITGMSQLHLDVIQRPAQAAVRPGGGDATSRRSRTARRSRPTARPTTGTRSRPAAAGQFGEVHMRVYPLPREIKTQEQLRGAVRQQVASSRRCGRVHYDPDYNFAFIDHIVGGTIPNQFMPAVEKGCKEMLERGALAGLPHAGRGRGGLLRQVPRRGQLGSGVQDGRPAWRSRRPFLAARPVLLEPIVQAGGDGAVASTPGRSWAT